MMQVARNLSDVGGFLARKACLLMDRDSKTEEENDCDPAEGRRARCARKDFETTGPSGFLLRAGGNHVIEKYVKKR
jgi:hypothetical protein